MYGSQFVKLTWMFKINGTEEIADTSLNLTTGPGWTGAVAALQQLKVAIGVPGDLTTHLDEAMNTSGLWWANYSVLSGLKMAAVGTDGHYLDEAPDTWERTGTVQIGTAGGVVAQSSVVTTLRSATSFGKGNYGRMYLPHTAIEPVPNTAMGAEATAQAIANAMAAFILNVNETVNDATTVNIYPHIMSEATGSPTKLITRVSVGTVTDTQRRRRNRLVETYKYASVAL